MKELSKDILAWASIVTLLLFTVSVFVVGMIATKGLLALPVVIVISAAIGARRLANR